MGNHRSWGYPDIYNYIYIYILFWITQTHIYILYNIYNMYICIYVFMYICIYICVCVCVCMYIYMCVYIYICTPTHTHIYIYIYTYISLSYFWICLLQSGMICLLQSGIVWRRWKNMGLPNFASWIARGLIKNDRCWNWVLPVLCANPGQAMLQCSPRVKEWWKLVAKGCRRGRMALLLQAPVTPAVRKPSRCDIDLKWWLGSWNHVAACF